MFTITTRKTSIYIELTIDTEGERITSGLLDENESLEMAKEFINAAEALLPMEYNAKSEALAEIRESLK